jgi:hypothetical protein
VHVDAVVAPGVLLELADRFQKGSPSMSPTVPPTSTMTTSVSAATFRIDALISSVMCGMTWTVRPR